MPNPSKHYFLGVGQGSQAARWLHAQYPDIQFHPAPNYLSSSEGGRIKRIGIDWVRQALAGSEVDELYAESQAAPAVVEALVAGEAALPKRLVLMQPLGLNPTAFGTDSRTAKKELFRRARRFWVHPSQSLRIAGNRWTMRLLIWSSLMHIQHVSGAYEYGARTDIRNGVSQLSTKCPVYIVATTEDSLFPYQELVEDTADESLRFIKLSGTHFNRATPNGAAQLRTVRDIIADDRIAT